MRSSRYLLAALSVALIATGLVMLVFRLFPVMVSNDDVVLVFINPISYWLIVAGAALSAVSIIVARRNPPRARLRGGGPT